MTRPSDHTREAIIKAAVHLFAEKGFDGTSVRDIVTKARVNQAAINYHFKSKDGLYLEVLKTAFERLTTDAGFDPEKLKSLSREQAVRTRSARSARSSRNGEIEMKSGRAPPSEGPGTDGAGCAA